MDVAVAGMAESGDEQALPGPHLLDERKELRDPAAGHDHVVIDLARGQAAQGVGQLPPRLPQGLALGLGGGSPHAGGARVVACRHGQGRVVDHRRFAAVDFHDEQRSGARRRHRSAQVRGHGAE